MNTKEENRIGVLGLGNRSTLHYIDRLNTKYNILKKGYSTFPITLVNTNFDTLNPYLPNQFEKLIPLMEENLQNLKDAGANFMLIPNISLHETIDKLTIPTNIAHPLHLTFDALEKKETQSVVIFGSYYTMGPNYVKNEFLKKNIQVVETLDTEKKVVDDLRVSIYSRQENQEEITRYQELINKYSKDQRVIIACTELSILDYSKNTNVIDMAELQIDAAISQKIKNN